MKFSRAAIAVYVGLIFASGAALGYFGDRLYIASRDAGKPAGKPNPEALRKKVVDLYSDRLHLNDEQVAKLNAILDETRARVEETRHAMRPAYQKIHDEQDQKIREMLTPQQQSEFDKIREERERRMKQQQNSRGVSVSR
jgi:hypothetical protein